MEATDQSTESREFKTTWDPRRYYEEFLKCAIWRHQCVEDMHNIFGKKATIPNSSLLDFGCGPIVANVVSASRVYENIYMADHVEKSIEEIRKWVNKEPGCMDYGLVCELTAQKEATGGTIDTIEHRVRNSIKGLLTCDILQDDPLLSHDCPRAYDAIIASHVLRVPCKDISAYKQSIKKLAALLKPNGILVMAVHLHQTFWKTGGQKYPIVSLNETDVRQAIQEAGLHSGEWMRKPLDTRIDKSYGDGIETVTFAATKK